MGLQQRFAGELEPDDPDFARASPATRRKYFDAAGAMILDELAKQLGKGIGRNGRQMRVRIQPVLSDGADGPVMEPHYEASRVITLADYVATDRGVTLFWHAGTGHRSHRRARTKGKSATPFGEILGYHAEGLVRGAPVRDVRLCKARVANVVRKLKSLWRSMKPRPKPKPETEPKPYTPTPPTPPTAPSKPRGASFTSKQVERFTAPPIPQRLPKPVKIAPGEHPTPTHPIPLVNSLPRGRVKGPMFVVSGKPKPPKAAPKPKPAPPPAPVPPPPPAPTVFERADRYATDRGVKIDTKGAAKVQATYPHDHSLIPGYFNPNNREVVLNDRQRYYADPVKFMEDKFADNWFSSPHPDHIVHHEVGHALHYDKIGHAQWVYLKRARFTPDQAAIAEAKVSRYAASEVLEFVAEVYASLVHGKRKIDPVVMALYNHFKGPLP
jgi:hypothetical protein